jgi:hypothetical protein
MAPAAIRMALVEGEDGDGLIVDEDSFQVARHSATSSAPDQVIAAILGTREGAVDAGLQLSSIGVTWTDRVQAAALRDALAAYKIENVMLVSGFLAAAALGQAVGGAIGYARTAVLFIEPDSVTLAIVDTADGSVCDVRRQLLAEDDDTAMAEVVAMVSDAEFMETRPDGVYVVGTGVDVGLIKPALEAATSLTVSVPEEHEMALARGAALASGNAPLFASTTAALAYAKDLGAPDVPGEEELAYSAVPDDVADDDTVERRSGLLIGSGLAVVAIAAVVALEIALAIAIRPTVALAPTPSENHFIAPTQQAPAPPQVVAAPQPKINLPAPKAPPRVASPQLPAPLPAAPVAPAPAVSDPVVVVPPVVPIVVPPIQAPGPDLLLRPALPQAPVRVPQLQPQVPQPRAQIPASPPRISNPAPQVPVRETPPGLGPSPNPGRGPDSGGPFGGGPFGGGGPGSPGSGGLFGGGGHGPFGGGGPGGFGGGGPGSPGSGGPFGGGGHGPFGGGGPGGFGGGGPGGHGGFGGDGPGGPGGGGFGGGPGGGGFGGGGHGGGGFGGGGGGFGGGGHGGGGGHR